MREELPLCLALMGYHDLTDARPTREKEPPMPPPTEKTERNQRIHEAYCRLAERHGCKPSPRAVLKEAGVDGGTNATMCLRAAMRPWLEANEKPPYWDDRAMPSLAYSKTPKEPKKERAKPAAKVVTFGRPSPPTPTTEPARFSDGSLVPVPTPEELVAGAFEAVARALVNVTPSTRKRVLQAALVFYGAQ